MVDGSQGLEFMVNADGTISPAHASGLVLGVGPVEDDGDWFRVANSKSAALCGLAVLRGDAKQAIISADDCTVHFGDAEGSVVGAPFLARSLDPSAQYLEVQVVSLWSDSFLQIGFAGSFFSFSKSDASGQDFKVGTWMLDISGKTYENDVFTGYWTADPVAEGDLIGLSYNFATGESKVSVNGICLQAENILFKSRIKNGPSVGIRAYPIICGKHAVLKFNLGTDLESSQFKYLTKHFCDEGKSANADSTHLRRNRLLNEAVHASKIEFSVHNERLSALCKDLVEILKSEKDAVQNGRIRDSQVLSQTELRALGLDAETIVTSFDRVVDAHKIMSLSEFNDDIFYRRVFNELIDTKKNLLNQQGALFLMSRDGAALKQLQRCSEAPCSDFHETQYSNDPCRIGYTWKSLFSGWSFYKVKMIEVPLNLPQCQIAVVWEAIAGAVSSGGTLKSVKLGH
jgi:hypothetical protein